MRETSMSFRICNWFSLEIRFHHVLERLNIYYKRVRPYEFHRYDLDRRQPQSRQLVLTDRWFWSASTSQFLNPYADPHLLNQTLPPVSRGSSPCQLIRYRPEHIKPVAKSNRLIAQMPSNTSYFPSDDTELATQYALQRPQDLVPSPDATDFRLSSAFANLSLNYEGVLNEARPNQQPSSTTSCRTCQKIFAGQPKLKYVAVFTCLAFPIEGIDAE
jgi:hypothetical protein